MAWMGASAPTSATTASASPPPSRIDCATRSADSAWMSATATRAPCSDSTRAHSSPRPEPAPVTMAILPFEFSFGHGLLLCAPRPRGAAVFIAR
jgi:hypothetical protein